MYARALLKSVFFSAYPALLVTLLQLPQPTQPAVAASSLDSICQHRFFWSEGSLSAHLPGVGRTRASEGTVREGG